MVAGEDQSVDQSVDLIDRADKEWFEKAAENIMDLTLRWEESTELQSTKSLIKEMQKVVQVRKIYD